MAQTHAQRAYSVETGITDLKLAFRVSEMGARAAAGSAEAAGVLQLEIAV